MKDTRNPKEELVFDAINYAIVGAGGIRIVFSSMSWSESGAIARARNLNCSLYAQTSFGKLFQVYPERREVPKRAKVEASVYPEMLTAAQRSSAYTSLDFV